MKVKVGIGPDDDVARVRAVREAVGPTVKLGVDANGGWVSADVAIPTIKRLQEFDIYFAEQPVAEGIGGLVADAHRLQLDIHAFQTRIAKTLEPRDTADGNGQQNLTDGPNDGTPTWSPDGRRIAFAGGLQHRLTIRVMNAASGDVRFTEFRNVPDDLMGRFEEIYRDVATGKIAIGA